MNTFFKNIEILTVTDITRCYNGNLNTLRSIYRMFTNFLETLLVGEICMKS